MNRRSALGVLGAGLGSMAFVPLRPVTFTPAALGRVRVGMTRPQARAIVGGPVDVLTRRDPELSLTSNVIELWCFGSPTHGDVPLHGSVGLDRQGRVAYVSGAGAPIATGLNERAQRSLWTLLAALPGLDGNRYDPLAVIRVVNALHALQKGPALAALREYLRVAPGPMAIDPDGIFLVLRALLDPSIAPPPMLVGAPDVGNPQGATAAFASFPLAMWGDVPTMLVGGYMLGGMPQPVSDHLDWFERNGRFRAAPLRPNLQAFASQMSAAQPALLALDGGNAPRAQGRRVMLCEQLLRAVRAVYDPPRVRGLERFDPAIDPAPRLQAMLGEMQRQGVAFRGDQFVRSGSTVAAPASRPRRERFVHHAPSVDIELVTERIGPDAMRVSVHGERVGRGGVFADTTLIVRAGGAALARCTVTPASVGSYSISEFALPAGASVTIDVEQRGRVVLAAQRAAQF